MHLFVQAPGGMFANGNIVADYEEVSGDGPDIKFVWISGHLMSEGCHMAQIPEIPQKKYLLIKILGRIIFFICFSSDYISRSAGYLTGY